MSSSELISLTSTVVRGVGFIDAEINDEIVALHIESGNCYALNRVGARVWHRLAGPVTVDQLCESLLQEFDVDRETCVSDVLDLLEALRVDGLVTVSGDE